MGLLKNHISHCAWRTWPLVKALDKALARADASSALAEPQFRGVSHGKNGSKWIKMIGPTKMRLKLLNATNFQTLKNWLGLTMFEHF